MSPADSAARVQPWRKARASVNDGACVEVASTGGLVSVRDSKNPGGSRLCCPARSWREFTARIRQG